MMKVLISSKKPGLLILILLALFYASSTLAAEDPQSLIKQCWSPEILAAKASEKRPKFLGKKAWRSAPSRPHTELPPVPKHLRGSIRRVELPEGKKLIALTLDLCEAPYEISGYDGAIIDYLRKHKIKTTFFSGGKWLISHPQRAQQLLADPLFEIGNHAWTHGNFRKLNKNKMLKEILFAQDAFRATHQQLIQNKCVAGHRQTSTLQKQMTLFRFPYGACRASSLDLVAQNGLLAIQWDVSTGDPSKTRSAKAIARHVLKSVRPGSIIIAHANGRGWNTAKALPLFIPELLKQGYRFVTVGELLQEGKPVVSQYCYDVVKGDTNRYDRRRRKRRKIQHVDFDETFQR